MWSHKQQVWIEGAAQGPPTAWPVVSAPRELRLLGCEGTEVRPPPMLSTPPHPMVPPSALAHLHSACRVLLELLILYLLFTCAACLPC